MPVRAPYTVVTGFTFGTIVLARLVATYLASQRDGP
jgi:hypothetical protein